MENFISLYFESKFDHVIKLLLEEDLMSLFFELLSDGSYLVSFQENSLSTWLIDLIVVCFYVSSLTSFISCLFPYVLIYFSSWKLIAFLV